MKKANVEKKQERKNSKNKNHTLKLTITKMN